MQLASSILYGFAASTLKKVLPNEVDTSIKVDAVEIMGKTLTINKLKVDSYIGIQYATKEHQFALPKLVDYEKPRKIDATKPGFICPSLGNFDIPDSESLKTFIDKLTDSNGAIVDGKECATLDVFTPQKESKEKNLNVVVYFHGGANESGNRRAQFNRGNGFYENKKVASKTIFVSVEYSLSLWGFIDERNLALRDQLTALAWVQKYISQFGGDPQKVTVMGHSSGAALAHTLQLALHGDNLGRLNFKFAPFRHLILMSGTASLFPPITKEQARKRRIKVMKKTEECKKKINEEDSEHIKCLKSLSTETLIKATTSAKQLWGPVIDDDLVQGDAEYHIQNGLFLRTKVMMTLTRNDASLFTIKYKKEVEEKGMDLWKLLGNENAIPHMEMAYGKPNDELNQFNITTSSATDACFTRPIDRLTELYKKQKVEVTRHVFDFELERLGGLKDMSNIISSVGQLHLYMSIMGLFHGFDQLLFLHTKIEYGIFALSIDTISSPSQIEREMMPVFEFMKNGKSKSAKFKVNKCVNNNCCTEKTEDSTLCPLVCKATDMICLRRALACLYGGKLPKATAPDLSNISEISNNNNNNDTTPIVIIAPILQNITVTPPVRQSLTPPTLQNITSPSPKSTKRNRDNHQEKDDDEKRVKRGDSKDDIE